MHRLLVTLDISVELDVSDNQTINQPFRQTYF